MTTFHSPFHPLALAAGYEPSPAGAVPAIAPATRSFELRGAVRKTAGAFTGAAEVIATLPGQSTSALAARPKATQLVPVAGKNGTAAAAGVLQIDPDGKATVTITADYVSLDGVHVGTET